MRKKLLLNKALPGRLDSYKQHPGTPARPGPRVVGVPYVIGDYYPGAAGGQQGTPKALKIKSSARATNPAKGPVPDEVRGAKQRRRKGLTPCA
jgi:hypothetical protein